jgi:hypothetical protein
MKDVSIFEKAPAALPDIDARFEPGFGQSRSLQPDQVDPRWSAQLIRQLERQILRTPGDLTAHVQRLNALLAAGLRGERIFAAALDLHIVLGGRGGALQRRIHEQIFPVLDDTQRTALVALRSGGSVSAAPAEQYCLLPRDHVGTVQLVALRQDEVSKTFPAVDFDIG